MPCCCNVHLHTLIILKEPYRPPACMLTDCGGLFSEFFVILYLFRLYGGNAQLPCLLLMDDFAAAIACVVVCFVRMARLPSPQLGLLLDGLTSYPLPCLTLPVRWGSKMNQYVNERCFLYLQAYSIRLLSLFCKFRLLMQSK